MKNFCEKYNVSRETYLKLKSYQSMLEDWQHKLNLVSKNTIENAWERHFLDSAQLLRFIPDSAKTLVDFGSGAGFPGMVLAIMLNEKTPYLKVTLVESILKKTVYLNAVKEQLGVDVSIVNNRIESIEPLPVDVITSRALTSLSDLLAYSYPFVSKNTVCIFPKGKKYAEELAEAHKHWKFKCDIYSSEQSEEGKILIISNIKKIKGGR
ncbi:MAG: 16S rRNA (guanine(527)-N(7))-methyltransferase RsmG [Alphaproteobacteria bacterium]|nr:16S rRNA (guanine(527)-N(7))-methyltransferase RsmG [Alphaproteobacteria bacterium]